MEESKNPNPLAIHFFYVTLILVLLIIGIITHKWTGIVEFREYLNVGATVTSLVLGILAIIYSFVSNGQQKGVLGAVEAAAATASTSISKIDGFINSAEKLQTDAALQSSNLSKLSDSLGFALEAMQKETSALLSTNAELASKVSTLPNQLGEIRGLIEKSSKVAALATSSPASDIVSLWNEKMIVSELKRTSLHGIAIICAFVKAKELNKCVSFAKFGSIVEDEDGHYAWGYVTGFSGTGLISIEINDIDETIYHPEHLHDLLIFHAQKEFESRGKTRKNDAERELYALFQAAIIGALVDIPETAPKKTK